MNEVTMEAVVNPENLVAACLAVKANGGAPGVDGMDTTELSEHLARHGEVIAERLLAGKFRAFAVRAVDIPKASGGKRRLGIPTVVDRMVQQALAQVLGPVFEEGFSEHSYGFRPGRSAHQAVRAAQGYIQQGKIWVVDIDLKSFFDQVNHDRLMRMVGAKVRDKRVLALIGAYLRAPLRLADGSLQKRGAGTPQGGPLSPLLANIYLDPLDKELEKRGLAFVRYADDIAIYAGSPEAAAKHLRNVIDWLRKELGLEVNLAKSGSGPVDKTSLLGFRFSDKGEISIASPSLQRAKQRVRQLWDARQNRTSEQLRDQWQSYIRGWWNYYGLTECRWDTANLSGWIRRHMRKCFWQRWHNRDGRRAALRRLGIKPHRLGMASCTQGAWAIAKSQTMHHALNNRTLHRYGFILPWITDFAVPSPPPKG